MTFCWRPDGKDPLVPKHRQRANPKSFWRGRRRTCVERLIFRDGTQRSFMEIVCRLLQEGQGEFIGRAQIALEPLRMGFPVGIPVDITPLFAFLSCREMAGLPLEVEGPKASEPAKPVRGIGHKIRPRP